MPTRIIHVLGTASGVGKSTICLGLLAWLVKKGVPTEELAYIKPVTQCVDQQPVALFCKKYGIVCRDIGPLIFSKGFTRKFLEEETGKKNRLLDEVHTEINAIGSGKRFLLIDGVGHPAVGSIVGLCNATLVNAHDNSRVLLVAPAGIGAAFDNIVLCLTFLQAHGINDVGVLLNHLAQSLESEISSYLEPALKRRFPNAEICGFLPTLDGLPKTEIQLDICVPADWIGENVLMEKVLFQAQTNR